MAHLRRRTRQVGGLLFAFVLMGVSACAAGGGPSKRELRKIATSAAVQTKREAAERDLRERVHEIEAGVPWLEPLSVVTYDRCVDVRGDAHLFDPNPPEQASMVCHMSSHILFSTDRHPRDVVEDVRRSGVTDWTPSSVSDALAYYGDDNGLDYPDQFVPLLTTGSGVEPHESLRWDTEKKKVSVNAAEDALWERTTHRYSERSVDRLRQENGVLYMWSVRSGEYHTAS
ncbi:hypothetical protein DMA10_18715 [Streptomyces sp. WAC 01420]|nr:hypothetical protein DLM49_26540 [Streptomyces sp. WAC 01438]RSM94412.1 hypothetical protein DMA10_18715 [Streptomyces sp. WAC 01420]